MEKVLLVLGIIFLIYLANKLKQDLFSPAVINLYWNSFFLIGAVVIFGGGLEWNYGGIVWIYLSMVMCLLGQLLGNKIVWRIKGKQEERISNLWPLGLVIMVFLGLGSSFFYLRAYGYDVEDLFNYEVLLEINSAIAYDRYYGHRVEIPSISIALNAVAYSACLCGGYLCNYAKSMPAKFFTLLTFVPIFVQTMINNAKVGFIASVFLWGTGWIISYLRTRRQSMRLTIKLGLVVGVLAIIGLIFLDFIMLLRIGTIDWETQQEVNGKMLTYAFGQVYSFCVWFPQCLNEECGFGTNTFMAIADWIGITVRVQGIYDVIEGADSNVFTQNRGLIADFGVLGAQIYWFFLGIIGSIAYRRVITGEDKTRISVLLLSSIIFSILYGFIISPWVYTSYIFAFVGFGCVLLVLKYFKISIRR